MSAAIFVILEQYAGKWHPMSLEALAAGQKLARELNAACTAVVFGYELAALAADLQQRALAGTILVEHPLLARYTADATVAALGQLLTERQPAIVLFPHTYQVRDFAPALATRLDRVLVSDVIGVAAGADATPGAVSLTRQLLQGRVNATYHQSAPVPVLASIQAGIYRADAVEHGSSPSAEVYTPTLDPAQIRTQPGERFRESAQTVDLSAAPVIVSVGRGIGDESNLDLIRELTAALGAELAASRPICDNGWLPLERQVGSSGQTVAPKLYLAVGISGAIQHLVGIKGAGTVVAINKDESAPIFEVADLAIVGDLFEIVPELTRAINAARG